MADYIVSVAVGTERRGWCDRCNTSAVLEWDVWAFAPVGTDPPLNVGTVGGCTTCEPEIFED